MSEHPYYSWVMGIIAILIAMAGMALLGVSLTRPITLQEGVITFAVYMIWFEVWKRAVADPIEKYYFNTEDLEWDEPKS